MKNVPEHLRKILWEYDIETLEKSDAIVLERILLYGDTEDIEYVGIAKLKRYFREAKPSLDPKSQNFWSVVFRIPKTPSPTLYDMINHPTSRRSFG